MSSNGTNLADRPVLATPVDLSSSNRNPSGSKPRTLQEREGAKGEGLDFMTQRRKRSTKIGLNVYEASAHIGATVSVLRKLVKDGKMPQPVTFEGLTRWDRDELETAFKALKNVNSWDVALGVTRSKEKRA